MAKLNYVSPNGSTVGLIFAHPDRLDVVEGSALSTRAGRFLKHTLYETGIKPSDCFIDYLLPSFPGRRGLSSIEAQDEMAEYNPALRRHISDNPTLKVLILFGPEVLPHFNITDSLSLIHI